jgi:hypothetical protein
VKNPERHGSQKTQEREGFVVSLFVIPTTEESVWIKQKQILPSAG